MGRPDGAARGGMTVVVGVIRLVRMTQSFALLKVETIRLLYSTLSVLVKTVGLSAASPCRPPQHAGIGSWAQVPHATLGANRATSSNRFELP